MFDSALRAVVVLFAMIMIGYLCQLKGWLGENAQTVMSRLALRVGLPSLVFSNILGNYDRAMLFEGAYSLLVPVGVITLAYLFSGLLVKWLRIPPLRRGVFRGLFTFSNTVFVGMPVCQAIFGDEAVTNVLLYYLVNTIVWWTIGAPAVARDGGKDMRNPLKRLASPPLIACMVSLLLVLVGFQPPRVVMMAAESVGAMVTPLSMVFIGGTLCTMLSNGLRWQKGYGVILLGRFVLAPLICLPLCLLLGITGTRLGVFFIESGLPTQTQSCIWAQEHGGDAEYAAGGIALSTLLGLVTIPIYAWVLGFIL